MYRNPTYSEMACGVMYQKVKLMQELHTMGNISYKNLHKLVCN